MKILTFVLLLCLEMKEVQHVVVCNLALQQFTSINCLNPYSKELKTTEEFPEWTLSNQAKSHLNAVRRFERLYH